LDGIARSRLGSTFPELVGFSLESDESQIPQTTQFSTRASCFIPAPECFVALFSPLELALIDLIQGKALIAIPYELDMYKRWACDIYLDVSKSEDLRFFIT
jgi:hypothetical protein